MSARGPSRRTRNMRRTCLVFHSTPGLARTEDLAALCAPLRQEPERNTTMPSLSEIAGDERTARMVLSMLVEPEDAVTGRLLATVGGVETLRLAESDSPVPGLGDVNARVWRGHFTTQASTHWTSASSKHDEPGSASWSPATTSGPVRLAILVSGLPTCSGLAGRRRSSRAHSPTS